MSVEFENFGFYKVNIDYVRYLNSKDFQVFYENNPNYERKPYLGLIIKLGNYKYCIPLTSSKERQLNWANITEHNYLINHHLHSVAICAMLIPYSAWYGGEHEPQPKK